jgi:type IV secretory pathway VirB2 component (pilin)
MGAAFAMEWEKLRPVHKTSRTVALAIGLAVTISALVCVAMASAAGHMSHTDRSSFDSIGMSLEGVNAAVLAIAAFGISTITREYATGRRHDPHAFAPWMGLGVLAGYVAATLVVGAIRMVRTDP